MKVLKRYEPEKSICIRLYGKDTEVRYFYLLECGHTTHGDGTKYEVGADIPCPRVCAVARVKAGRKLKDRGMDK